ncbi:peptidylprolyl isomerase [Deinococcus reticulitermitis]|uniref:Peptidyl-prolyl cis-trans isomerase n=1 Tax=Deinococcus reticulitermitis TaxID=856736 RepID=A0A1H6S3T8_9DEIO|nr:peptidylprolyl isomerase [Deinococcus reticulitermitis]SEI58690.1 peptidylprolyl isomerase [Deinococcus reticulitermitis]
MQKTLLTAFLGLGLVACAPATNERTYTLQPAGAAPAAQASTATIATSTTVTETQTASAAATQTPTAQTPAPVTPAPQSPATQTPAPATQTTTASVSQTPAGGWTTVAPLSAARVTTFTAARQVIDPAKRYRAVLKTSKGDVTVSLDAKGAPLAVNNFVFLALNRFYDGTRFHRVIEGFMAQGGDPLSADPAQQERWGTGGPGYRFANEQGAATFDKAGVLAMANAGRDTNGSQFFITFGPAAFLNGGYTIFGQVEGGLDVVNSLTRTYDNAGPIAGRAADVLQSVEIQVSDAQ